MNYEDWKLQLDEGLAMKEIQRVDKQTKMKTDRKAELAQKLEKSQKANATKPLSASPEVMQARKNRKAKEANATPALSASPDVLKAREARNTRARVNDMKTQVRKAPEIKHKPAEKAAEIIRNKPQTNSTPKPQTNNTPKPQTNNDAGGGKGSKKRRQDQDVKKANQKDGFVGGLKSSFGGDVFRKGTDAKSIARRKEARRQAGKNVGDFVKKTPGRLVNTVLKHKSPSAGTSDSQDLAGPKKGVYNG